MPIFSFDDVVPEIYVDPVVRRTVIADCRASVGMLRKWTLLYISDNDVHCCMTTATVGKGVNRTSLPMTLLTIHC